MNSGKISRMEELKELISFRSLEQGTGKSKRGKTMKWLGKKRKLDFLDITLSIKNVGGSKNIETKKK